MSVSKCTSFQHCPSSREECCKVLPKVGMVVGAILLALGPLLFCYGIGRFPIMAAVTAGGLMLAVACAIIKCCQPKKETRVPTAMDKPQEKPAAQAPVKPETPPVPKATLAHLAALQETLDSLKKAIEKQGSDCLNQNSEFGTLLHCAVSAEDKERQAKINYLLQQNGISIEARNSKGLTPLLLAITFDDAEAAGSLLAKGADLFAKTDNSETAFHLAAENFDSTFVPNILLASKEKMTPKELTAFVNAKRKDGHTALTRLLEVGGLLESYVALLEGGATEPDLAERIAKKVSERQAAAEKVVDSETPVNQRKATLEAMANKSPEIKKYLNIIKIHGYGLVLKPADGAKK